MSDKEQMRPVALEAYDSMAEAYAAAIEENPRSIQVLNSHPIWSRDGGKYNARSCTTLSLE